MLACFSLFFLSGRIDSSEVLWSLWRSLIRSEPCFSYSRTFTFKFTEIRTIFTICVDNIVKTNKRMNQILVQRWKCARWSSLQLERKPCKRMWGKGRVSGWLCPQYEQEGVWCFILKEAVFTQSGSMVKPTLPQKMINRKNKTKQDSQINTILQACESSAVGL